MDFTRDCLTGMITKSTSTDEGEPPERSAGFVLFSIGEEGERRFLLLRHRNGGHWGFPKGRIEAGEEDRIAALREAREETGIDEIEPIPSFRATSTYRFIRNGSPVSKEATYFLGRVGSDDVVLSDEHVECRWLAFPSAWEILTYAVTREVLRAANLYLEATPAVSK